YGDGTAAGDFHGKQRGPKDHSNFSGSERGSSSRSSAATAARSGTAALAPRAVVASAPAAHAQRNASCGPRCQATASAPVNASPAPVVSTTGTANPGTDSRVPSGPR